MSDGMSVASQKATNGNVGWGCVVKDALIGTAIGARGAGTGAALASKMRTGLAVRATTGAARGMVEGARPSRQAARHRQGRTLHSDPDVGQSAQRWAQRSGAPGKRSDGGRGGFRRRRDPRRSERPVRMVS